MARTKVNEIMSSRLAVCTKDTTIEDAVNMMVSMDCGAIPVVDSNESVKPIGMITDRDIVERTMAKGLNPIGKKVEECMTNNCFTIQKEATLPEALKVMEKNQIRRLTVIDNDGKCCGILSQADVALNSTDGKVAKLLRQVSKPSLNRSKKVA